MTTLDQYIETARQQAASDLHLEAGLPAAMRVRGCLKTAGEPVAAQWLQNAAHELIGAEGWDRFLEQRSADLSKTIQGVRCRINIMRTSRGVGMAIRLLASFQATIDKLNLHPDIKRFIVPSSGLVLVSGATGSGKSSTLAALIQEINTSEARHIVTIESPIEYFFRPRNAFIRQREVGRDTPSFEQALIDALREDPDVLMVGEMRDPETMRLTLNASETGHLVLATVHSGSCVEALQRVVSAFRPEIQQSVAAQLADCLVGVLAQKLIYRPDLKIRLPECEILTPNNPVKHYIRQREFHKIKSSLETGADFGMWTFARYRTWMEKRTHWHIPDNKSDSPDSETAEPAPLPLPKLKSAATPHSQPAPKTKAKEGGPIEIEPVEGGWDRILKELK
jgi:twitching motility protein PilT